MEDTTADRRFTDSKGRDWDLTITVAALQRCKTLADIDLAAKVETDLFDDLADDPILLCNTLAAILRPQMAQRDIDDEAFAAGLGGDVIDDAAAALIEALVYFFRNRHGGIVAKIARKRKTLNKMADKAVDAYIDSGQIERRLKKVLAEQLGPQFGDAPGSSG
ncbi:MAG: hypothetical protein U9N87_08860 [Planctomycetota bacterium]|nr:hypothetical protein [Planctomycetota bacterium]